MGGRAFAFPKSAAGTAGYQQTRLATPPPGSFSRQCIFPLPENTSLLAIVPWPDDKGHDFYYRQDPSPNAKVDYGQWVCGVAKPTVVGGAAIPKDPVIRPEPGSTEARPGIIVRTAEEVLGPIEAAKKKFEELKKKAGTVGLVVAVGAVSLLVLYVVVSAKRTIVKVR